jgi:hypothetical protein
MDETVWTLPAGLSDQPMPWLLYDEKIMYRVPCQRRQFYLRVGYADKWRSIRPLLGGAGGE